MKNARPGFVVLSCLASVTLGAAACKAKRDSKADPEPAPAPPVSAPVASPAPAPTPPAPAPGTAVSDEERALAAAFIERFLTAIEGNDAAAWPGLHTVARREALEANNAVDKSYEAWRHGTLTAIPFIRKSEFDLQRSGNGFVLRFVGVKVPTDPETEYSMTVAIEDGEMRISEK